MILAFRRESLAEYGTLREVPLSSAQAALLDGSRALSVAPSIGGGWTLQASSVVGIVQAGDVEVRIQPKVPVRRLFFLLGFAADPRGWEAVDASLGSADDLIEAVAHAFLAHAERAIRQGVLQGYLEREEAMAGLRGRLREADQLRTRFGLPIPVEVRYDDFSTDITENRALAGAARVLIRFASLGPVRSRLRHLLSVLGNVQALRPGQPIPPITFTRLNERYRAGLHLARLILTHGSTRFAVGDVVGTTLTFDMNKVFEDFLTRALRLALERRGGHVSAQHVSSLDEGRRLKLKPDITWWHSGRCLAVADAKYKSLVARGLPNPDVYQMLAYCTAYGLDRGHLVYARGNDTEAQHHVRSSPIQIRVHTLDLDRSPPELMAEVDRLADRIVQGLPAALTGRADVSRDSAIA